MTADTITPPPSEPVGWPFSAIVPVLWVVLALTMLAFIVFWVTAAIEKFRGSSGPEAVQRMVFALLASVLVAVTLATVQAVQ